MNKGDLSHKCKVTETSENQYNSQLTRKNSHVNKCRKSTWKNSVSTQDSISQHHRNERDFLNLITSYLK